MEDVNKIQNKKKKSPGGSHRLNSLSKFVRLCDIHYMDASAMHMFVAETNGEDTAHEHWNCFLAPALADLVYIHSGP